MNSNKYFIAVLAALLVIMGCKKDSLLEGSLADGKIKDLPDDPPVVTDKCNRDTLFIDVDSLIHNSFYPVLSPEVCDCDTIDIIVIDVRPPYMAFGWFIYGPVNFKYEPNLNILGITENWMGDLWILDTALTDTTGIDTFPHIDTTNFAIYMEIDFDPCGN